MRSRVTSRAARLVTTAAAGALLLATAACGGDDSGDGGSDGSTTSSSGKVGVILPETTTSPRWEANDKPALKAAFDKAGVDTDIQNAAGDVDKFGTICDGMINSGVNVLIIVNVDSESGTACLKKATDAGIPSIDYDRLTLGGGAKYYVSYDNVVVGKTMGEGLQHCLDEMGKTKANIAYINGKATDNNATLFKQGYEEALKSKIDSGDYKLVGDQSGEWDATVAGQVFDGIYAENKGKVDGVVSANDTMAGGIIARLKANSLAGKVPVTGQDASVEGLQRILDGTQCMTVFKDTTVEANAAADLAIALLKGDTEKADSMAKDTVPDSTTNAEVPSVLLTPQAIYKDSVKDVIAAGYQPKDAVCTGQYAQLCTDNGVQ